MPNDLTEDRSTDTLSHWWDRVERESFQATPASSTDPLIRLALADLRLELSQVDTIINTAASQPYSIEQKHIFELLQLRIFIRKGQPASTIYKNLENLLNQLGPNEQPTKARLLHTKGVLLLKLDQLDEAENALLDAHDHSPSTILHMWVLDTIAQVLLREGAWQEARRTLIRVVRMKQQMGDVVGMAISVGTLGRMFLQLGEPEEAEKLAEQLLNEHSSDLPLLSTLRLHTLLLESVVEQAQRKHSLTEKVTKYRLALEALWDNPPAGHTLYGFAALTIARAYDREQKQAKCAQWLDMAKVQLSSLREGVEYITYWQARLLPDRDLDAQLPAPASSKMPSEAEIGGLLLQAERAIRDNNIEQARILLDIAHERAASVNNRLWVEWVYRTARMLDPVGAPERLARRFAGRSIHELEQTKVTDATIIFADLVGFTPRSLELEPEEVMATVRSLFELSVPSLSRFKVRPLSCLGDALLAVAEGPDHEKRGLNFALDLVKRAGRVSRVRMALGDRWGMNLRAGVASGPVVLGALGNHFKLEFAAIGLTTNLAARLQSAAQSGQVVCCDKTAQHLPELPRETLSLKGFDHEVQAVRFLLAPAVRRPSAHLTLTFWLP